jgi:hypothetical protein
MRRRAFIGGALAVSCGDSGEPVRFGFGFGIPGGGGGARSVAAPSASSPSALWGARDLEELYATGAYVSHTAGAADVWTDTAPAPHNYTASLTARPAYTAADGSLGSLGYITGDGSNDVMTSTLDIPAPATTPTFHAMLIRQDSWTDLDRIMAGTGVGGVHLFYQRPITPFISMLNGASAEVNTNPASALATWQLVMAQFSGSQFDWLQVGNTRVSGLSAGNSVTTGRKLFGDISAGRFSNIKLAHKLAVSGLVTDSELATYAQYLRETWGVSSTVAPVLGAVPDVNIVLEGDSISRMASTTGVVAATRFSTGARYVHRHNVAISGTTIADMTARYATNVAPRYNAACPINIYTVRGGANDVAGGGDLALLQSRITANIANAVATGWERIWVFPIREAGSWTAGQNTVISDFNTWLEANYLSIGATRFVEIRNLIPNQFNSPEWNADTLHATTTGSAFEVPAYEAAFAAEV